MHPIHLRRIYDNPGAEDGFRVLVDRLWPRGLTREKLAADLWLKEIAPSPGLRRWFGHDPERWEEFRRRYIVELGRQPELVEQLRERARKSPLTLLYAARDEIHNQAVVLKEYLESGRNGKDGGITPAPKTGGG